MIFRGTIREQLNERRVVKRPSTKASSKKSQDPMAKKLHVMKSSIVSTVTLLLHLICSTSQAHDELTSRVRKLPDEPTSYFRKDSIASLFDGQVSFDDYVAYSLRALALVAGFDNDIHRYDARRDLINSFARNLSYADNLKGWKARVAAAEKDLLSGEDELTLINNEKNQAICGAQLDSLLIGTSQLFASSHSFSSSRQLSLIDYLDSFGSPSTQLMRGNALWLGSYDQCTQAKLTFAQDHSPVATRYCIASFHSQSWPRKQPGTSAIKLGVCLPETCNSISFLRHRKRIEKLIKVSKLNQVPFADYELSGLYCLPDESSPLRQFSTSARIFILCLSSWLTLVIYFSLKYEFQCIKRSKNNLNQLDYAEESKCIKIFALRLSWRKLFEQPEAGKDLTDIAHIRAFIEKGHDSQQGDCSLDTSDSESSKSEQVERCNRISNIIQTVKRSPLGLSHKAASVVDLEYNQHANQSPKAPAINLSVIDSVKVISMIWLISAHTLLYFIRTIANGRDFWSILKDARFMTVMAGIFPVDTFFTVTGILTSYLKFNKNDGVAMSKFSYWIEAFVHRYLRFMPLYIIVFWYTRDISEYIGKGPLWDYGTANTSLRSVCKEESFSVPLLFQANFKPIDLHCVKPAWYLANDYQYLLITPLFMALILKSTRLGYSFIGLSIFSSLIMQFFTVFFSTEMEDFGALVNFKPMFAVYVLRNLWKLYVLPYNRIPPYLIGLMTGHLMYSMKRNSEARLKKSSEIGKNSVFLSQDSTASTNSATNLAHLDSASEICILHNLGSYISIRVWKPLMLLISIIYLPMLTRVLTHDGIRAEIGTSSIIALMRFTWSLAIARLIFLCATNSIQNDKSDSFVVRLLSSPKWKPWSKIGLSALLIQWEVISYLAQSQTSAPEMTITFLMGVILLCIVGTYVLALLIYLTLEYPLSQVEQLYIHPVFFHK